MNFPQFISFTLTNACNLRCRMCGQWSDEGYIHNRKENEKSGMTLPDWKRLVDEAHENGIRSVLLRGGEPFLFPQILELLEYIHSRDFFISIDTNGTLLEEVAEDLVRIGQIHITISVDGTGPVHDRVRGVEGCFGKIKKGLEALKEAEEHHGKTISKSICFTISPWSLESLGEMPSVAKDLRIGTLVIVPYCYVTGKMGKAYEKEMKDLFGVRAFSWKGFRHDTSGVDPAEFLRQLARYRADLAGLHDYPYLKLSDDGYEAWFRDAETEVGSFACANVERIIDIQPDGDAGFCVDLPDFSYGNVLEAGIQELWNSEKAVRFREYRRKQRFSACHRCVAKYMAEQRDSSGNIITVQPE